MKNLVRREEYLDFLKRHRDKSVIKVVSGVRRSGKSTLFHLFQEELKLDGVRENQIILLNFEDFSNRHLLNPEPLHDFLVSKISDGERYYIFLDEIQMVEQFEKVVDSIHLRDNVDLYITVSNAYFLSGELATLLSGRYVQLNMLPLSYKEFVHWHKENGDELLPSELYERYVSSSFPYTLGISDPLERFEYLRGLYSTVVLNDIVKRLDIKDVSLLERLIETLFSMVGSLVTINKIRNTLVSNQYQIAHQTVDRYIGGILDSLILYECKRFDIHGRKLLEKQSKYYAVDLGLRQLVLRDHLEDYGHILENIVFLELKRRGYQVYVGQSNKVEVDFVAIAPDQSIEYYQVALSTLDRDTLARELRSLQEISDQYPKTLLTLDLFDKKANYDGIQKINVLDWLLGEV